MAGLVTLVERAVGRPGVALGPGDSTAPGGPPGACAGRPQILVVDDNPSHLGNACEALGSWGITPMVAEDGAEAVALAGVYTFDLILMDLQMPVLDGLAATKQIRIQELERSRARVPVLAHTSQSVESGLLLRCGVDGVLEKPCDPASLRQCLLRWCGPPAGYAFERGGQAGRPSPR
jgi:CheY-like chemotaxis protein